MTSDTFRFYSDTTLDATWNDTGAAPFCLWLISAGERATAPNCDRILVNDVTGRRTGTAKQKLIASDWAFQIEQVAWPWAVQSTPES